MLRIFQSMKSGLRCFQSKIQRKINFINVLLLVFGVFLLMCYLSIFSSFSESDEVEGWEKSKNRRTIDYVHPEKLTAMTSTNYTCKLENPLILIIVCSDIEHTEQRKAVRETWAVKARRNGIIVLFLMGISGGKEISPEVMEENINYGDIIIEDFIDTYNNLTIKSIMMLKWVNQNCLSAKFIMKVDDDVYVNVNNLLKVVKPVKNSDLPGFLLGKLYTRERPQKKPSSKWFMPDYMFSDDFYPHYLCGVGYIMSFQVARALYTESLKNDLVYLEDLFITGICAKKANLKPVDHLAFHFFEHPVVVECNSIHPYLILLSHHLSASKMRNQHRQMLECWRGILLPEKLL